MFLLRASDISLDPEIYCMHASSCLVELNRQKLEAGSYGFLFASWLIASLDFVSTVNPRSFWKNWTVHLT